MQSEEGVEGSGEPPSAGRGSLGDTSGNPHPNTATQRLSHLRGMQAKARRRCVCIGGGTSRRGWLHIFWSLRALVHRSRVLLTGCGEQTRTWGKPSARREAPHFVDNQSRKKASRRGGPHLKTHCMHKQHERGLPQKRLFPKFLDE